jgi:hypothetical protein
MLYIIDRRSCFSQQNRSSVTVIHCRAYSNRTMSISTVENSESTTKYYIRFVGFW